MSKLNVDQTFVVHVSKGAEERAAFMEKQLEDHGITFEYMLRGDLSEIDNNLHHKYFSGYMIESLDATVSCALKHIYIMEEMLARDLDLVLILEDDVVLHKDFVFLLNSGVKEARERADIDDNNFFVSLEDNRSQLPKREEIKGKYLYKKHIGRYAGAYLLSKGAAGKMLDRIRVAKCHRHIDWFHNDLAKEELFPLFWMHPTIAEQGSHNGKFKSLLDNKPKGWLKALSWRIQTFLEKNLRRRFK